MKRTLLLIFAVWCGLGGSAALQATPAAIAPFVDEHTFVVIHVDVKNLDLEAVLKKVEAMLAGPALKAGLSVPELRKQIENAQDGPLKGREMFLKSGAQELYFLMNWAEPMDAGIFLIPVPAAADKDTIAGELAKLVEKPGQLHAKVHGQVVVLGTKASLERLGQRKAKERPGLAKALEATGTAPIRAVAIVPDALRKALQENMPNLPRELGGASTEILGNGLVWAAIAWNPKESLAPRLTIQSRDAAAAEDLAKLWKQVLESASQLPAVQEAVPHIAELTAQLAPTVKGDRLTLAIEEKAITQVLGPGVVKVREAAARTQSINNLKQIALAMHVYHDTRKTLPASASYDAQGKPLLSWRVHILPYIEQNDLYKEFKLDEPWDSDHNKKLIARMPAIYQSPLAKAEKGKTTYLVPLGPKTIFDGKKGLTFGRITDGSSNTIMVLESDDKRGVVWTQPEDYKIDAKKPLAGLVREGAKGFLVALADGSVRVISATINPDTLRALYTATGGEAIEDD